MRAGVNRHAGAPVLAGDRNAVDADLQASERRYRGVRRERELRGLLRELTEELQRGAFAVLPTIKVGESNRLLEL
jgi:hypothetical protein